MAVTNLTNTKWIFNSGVIQIDFNTEDYVIDFIAQNNESYQGIKFESPDTIWYCRSYGDEDPEPEDGYDMIWGLAYIIITGGRDVTNSNLIKRLEQFAVMSITPSDLNNTTWIFDRTQADVDRVKYLRDAVYSGYISEQEMNLYKQDLKGAINENDLRRIVGNMQAIAELLDISISTQTVPEIPKASWYETFRNDLSILLNNYMKHEDTPDIPDRPFNTYQKWNTIEKILWDIVDIYKSSENAHAGNELYANNNVII